MSAVTRVTRRTSKSITPLDWFFTLFFSLHSIVGASPWVSCNYQTLMRLSTANIMLVLAISHGTRFLSQGHDKKGASPRWWSNPKSWASSGFRIQYRVPRATVLMDSPCSISESRQAELREAIEQSPLAGFCKIFFHQLLGWPMYLFGNITGQRSYPSGTNREFLS
jgi:hypothetical protein